MSVTVQYKDKGAEKVLKALKDFNSFELTIGYQGPSGAATYEDSGITVAQNAAFQEFGTREDPQRSFLRSTMKERRKDIIEVWATESGRALEGKQTALRALSRIGEAIVDMIREKLDRAQGWAWPLDASTVEEKGSRRPLFETGKLYRNLSWAVRKGGTVVRQGGTK